MQKVLACEIYPRFCIIRKFDLVIVPVGIPRYRSQFKLFSLVLTFTMRSKLQFKVHETKLQGIGIISAWLYFKLLHRHLFYRTLVTLSTPLLPTIQQQIIIIINKNEK